MSPETRVSYRTGDSLQRWRVQRADTHSSRVSLLSDTGQWTGSVSIERGTAIVAWSVYDDLLSLQTIEDHPKFGRVHFLFVGPNDESVNNHLE